MSLGMDLVTSSQTLREKDIQPSKLNFGFLGLGKELNQCFGSATFWLPGSTDSDTRGKLSTKIKNVSLKTQIKILTIHDFLSIFKKC